MTQTAEDNVLNFGIGQEMSVVDVLKRDREREIERMAIQEGRVRTARHNQEMARQDEDAAMQLVRQHDQQVQNLTRAIQAYELADLKPKV